MRTRYSKDLSRIIKGYYGMPATKKIVSKQSRKVVITQSYDNGVVLNMTYSRKETAEYEVPFSGDGFVEYEVPMSADRYVEYEVLPVQEEPAVARASSVYQQALGDDVFVEEYDIQSDTSHAGASSSPRDRSAGLEFFEDLSHETSAPAHKLRTVGENPVSSGHTAGDDDFFSDMKSILRGEKKYEKDKGLVEAKTEGAPAQPAVQPAQGKEEKIRNFENEHAIFDKIAQSMQYANAYDLGTFTLEQRLDDFDRIDDIKSQKDVQKPARVQRAGTAPEKQGYVTERASRTDFVEDLEAIKETTAAAPVSPADTMKTAAKVSPSDTAPAASQVASPAAPSAADPAASPVSPTTVSPAAPTETAPAAAPAAAPLAGVRADNPDGP